MSEALYIARKTNMVAEPQDPTAVAFGERPPFRKSLVVRSPGGGAIYNLV